MTDLNQPSVPAPAGPAGSPEPSSSSAVPVPVAPATPAAAPSRAHFTRHFRAAMSDDDRRTVAQQHLNSRTGRISAYAASLEAALAVTPPGDRAALLRRRLDQARQDLAAASRMRLPDEATPRPRGARVRLAASPVAPAAPTAPTAPTASTAAPAVPAVAPTASIGSPR